MRKILLIMMLLSAVYLSAEEKKVGLVFNRATGVNRHALQFIMAKGGKFAKDYRFQAIDITTNINSTDYDALILVNTGIASGIDPVLDDFLTSVSEKNKIILLNLYEGRSQSDFTFIPAGANNFSVDSVTSATLWGGRSVKAMHESWLHKVIDLISQL